MTRIPDMNCPDCKPPTPCVCIKVRWANLGKGKKKKEFTWYCIQCSTEFCSLEGELAESGLRQRGANAPDLNNPVGSNPTLSE